MDDSIAIRTEGLTKRFGSFTAVDDLTVEIPRGGVVGLLGPNGAGKSTLIRTLLGLIRPTEGRGEVLGHSITEPTAFLPRVGALIEAPTMYPKLSGLDNLRTLAVLQDRPKSRINEVLDIVGLAGRAGDRFTDYSLGMKQRLGIAAALLRDPDILMLDEPTNGLDPAGIVEIRELLMRLGAAGKTVFVSSHLLAEIQAACDRLVIIARGRLIFEGDMSALLEHTERELWVEPELAEDRTRLKQLLTDQGLRVVDTADKLRLTGDELRPADLNRLAAAQSITLSELSTHHEDLEDVFLRLTTNQGVR